MLTFSKKLAFTVCVLPTTYLAVLVLWNGSMPDRFSSSLQEYAGILWKHSTVQNHVASTIAVACHLTGRLSGGQNATAAKILSVLPFFQLFLPSLCEHASHSGTFTYGVYVMLELDNGIKKDNVVAVFQRICNNSNVNAHIIGTPGGKLTPVDATNYMLISHAYMGSYDFYLKSQCDEKLADNWDQDAESQLLLHSPVGCGAVFLASQGGSVNGVMVHRTHLDLFNVFYPHSVKDEASGQAWIKCLYEGKALLKTLPPKFSLSNIKDAKCDRRHLERYCI